MSPEDNFFFPGFEKIECSAEWIYSEVGFTCQFGKLRDSPDKGFGHMRIKAGEQNPMSVTAWAHLPAALLLGMCSAGRHRSPASSEPGRSTHASLELRRAPRRLSVGPVGLLRAEGVLWINFFSVACFCFRRIRLYYSNWECYLPGIVHAHSTNCLLGTCDLNVEGNCHSLLGVRNESIYVARWEKRIN